MKKNKKILKLIIIILTVPLLKKNKINSNKKESYHIKLIIKNKIENKVMMNFKHIIRNRM